MQSITLTAIILKSIPFQDQNWMITALSKEMGLISFVSKGKFKKNMQTNANLTLVELVLAPTKTDIFRLIEFKTLHFHLFLRNSFEALKIAQSMAKVILQTQWLQAQEKMLFYFLQKSILWIEESAHLQSHFAFFLLKVLKYEGIFHMQTTCTICQNPIKQFFVYNGETRCKNHCDQNDKNNFVYLDESEVYMLKNALDLKEKEQVLALDFEPQLIEKINTLYSQLTKKRTYGSR